VQAAEQKSKGLTAVMDASFEGNASVISNSLTNLLAIASTNKPGGFFSQESDEMKNAKKEVYTAFLGKIETGIMLLNDKGGASMAELYQKNFWILIQKEK
jgi:hypothetical protein